jgi:hypothetical protein
MIKRFIMLAVVLGSALPVHAQYYLRQSTASQEMLIGPFLDDTDGKTAETGLTIANTDVKLWKRGATSEANKNSGGGTHVAAGRYYITLDDTDTNTLGELEINVVMSGALPVQKRCIVLPANVFDSVVLGSDKLDTNAAELGGTAQTGRDVGASVLVSVGSGAGQINVSSGKVPATIAVGDIATGAVTADAIAADAVGSSELAATAVDEIVDATWDEPYSGHTTAGTPGQVIPTLAKLDTAIALDGAVYRFTANALELAPTGGLDAAAIRAALGLASANLDTQLGAIDDYVDTEVAAILADTGTDGVKVDAASTATAVWNAATATYGTSGSYGEALEAVGSAADPWLTNLPGAYGAGTAGYRIGTYLDAAISSRASQTSVDTVDDLLDTEVAAILADTNELQTDWVNGGRLDLLVDAILADTNELQADWVNGGRLDLLIDAIKAVTDKFGFTGTSPYYVQTDVVDWNGSAAPAMTGDAFAVVNHATYGNAALETAIDGISAGSGLTMSDAVPDPGTAGTVGQALRKLLDNLDAPISGVGGAVGPGGIAWTVTLKTGAAVPIADADVWVTTDSSGTNVVAGKLQTDAFGKATFMLDAGTYYRWAQKSGVNFTNPSAFTVVAP